jgi:predicted NBD/HSP70 family sugar kinase
LAAQGDRAAEAAVDGISRILAQAFGIMINLLNLEACIIGAAAMAASRVGSS